MLRTLEEWKTYSFEEGTTVFDILEDWKESDLKWKVDLLEAKVEFLESLIKDLLKVQAKKTAVKFFANLCDLHILAKMEEDYGENHACEYMENGHCKICGESYNGH